MSSITNTKNPIQVADRLFQVLETLAINGEMGLQELTMTLQLNKSTTHRLLTSLIFMGYVKQDNHTSKYRLSFKIWELANHLLKKIDVVEIAKPHLKELVRQIDETVHLVQLEGNDAIYLDKVESFTNSIRMASNVGKSLPLYCSGVGKALLAQMDNATIASIWKNSDITAHTEHTITSYDDFLIELETIRSLGYALDNEENEKGVRCIAVSLQPQEGIPHYAFSISAPIHRMSDERIQYLIPEILNTKKILQEILS